jgi:TPR repeat protein
MNNLALLYKASGKVELAIMWWRRSASQGNLYAMNNLGAELAAGGQKEEALVWFDRASRKGHAAATRNLTKLRSS